ncbi:MAG: valine--tRNA ligase [Candidatus Omnitrophica bacterium]|nr:valine--tRNA ligase [Candidatus Omnitrophota bacterium]
MEELATKYSFDDIEEKWYNFWLEKEFFHARKNLSKTPFSIVIPPPNVTGILHMGHALNNTIQDILIRFKKMNGFESLWMPGTDHAGIATQNVVERKIAREGMTRQQLGREKFLENVWQWKEEYGSTIIRQLKRLGCACDWQRARFTMDEEYSDAVIEVFIRLFKKGLIYRGNYIINWCPRCQTALADEEAPHKEIDGFLYYIKYPFKNSSQYLVVATTRPETMLGDTAVAVNPKDLRYNDLIGKTIILPLIDREILVIADDFVDPEFGTGAVKVTPAHDQNDYLMGKRHNLEFINIFSPDARCNELSGDYAGSDRFEARQAIIEDLKERKLLEKVVAHKHTVGHCYRCHTVIEPYLSKQWFVKMKPLALPGIEAVEKGDIKFHPQRWTKVYLNWMQNIQDWCISRQIWWGHRIPAWYCGKCNSQLQVYLEKGTGNNAEISLDEINVLSDIEPIVSKEKPCCDKCGSAKFMIQDPQVLDTWFSSWLRPFATFGWPFTSCKPHALGGKLEQNEKNKTGLQKEELKYFYPTTVLVTAPEIIFFWVARMIIAGFEFMQNAPFKDVYIHGTVRDDSGKKMSKSLGNSIDPLEIIAEYGTDALRFSLVSNTAIGQDVFLSKEKFEFGRNFCNKIWNASRFILMNLDSEELGGYAKEKIKKENLALAEAWVLSRFYSTLKQVNIALDNYRLNEAANIIYEFFWHQFCDWYIELAKLSIENTQTQAVLFKIVEQSLRLLHPFIPFVSEEIWQKFKPGCGSILEQSWPQLDESFINEKLETNMQIVIDVCTAKRNLRNENNYKPKDIIEQAYIKVDSLEAEKVLIECQDYIKKLAKVDKIFISQENIDMGYSQEFASCSTANTLITIPVKIKIDAEREKQKFESQINEISNHILRKDRLLNNENYLKKAPSHVVEKEKQSLDELKQELEKLIKIKDAIE